ncbi:hypothetical protein RD792_015427 [Penstemon davidsonii]|uniref:Aluminum-activated malate transporter 9 n=1 Tax=Penstemon davidsonii TaxID=160366 RepID=A0ABR0CS10_9LAMI|nr:hypothetical protein RD792_015420 [Penstemon davidsonii]KAK4479883.1 hypothetical protein RD792_015427 [Penstemon davidsonii]
MGFALSLVSLLIFFREPLPDISHSIWAILTVIVMFEFSIGATFIKGFNRGIGTFLAGMLAFLFAALSVCVGTWFGGEWEKVVIVISFFVTGSFGSYLRFYPSMAPYDYGFRVFVLTYCILMVAGNRTREYAQAIISRLVLFAVGGFVCFLVNMCIYPIWSGDDLESLVVSNLKELATSLEGCVNGYLKYVDYARTSTRFSTHQAFDDQLLHGYKTVIESATIEQNLLGFAIWEPPHGKYRKVYNPPWKSYVKVSSAIRHCAYTVMALHGCILSEIQAPSEKRQVFRNQLQLVSTEGAKVLRELGKRIEKMEKIGTDENILKQVHEVAEQLQKTIDQRSYLLVNSESWKIGNKSKELNDLGKENKTLHTGFKSQSETAVYVKSPLLLASNKDLPKKNKQLRKHAPWPSWISFQGVDLIKEDEVETFKSASALSLATFASLLIEFVARLQNVVDCFEELSEKAEFKDPNVASTSDTRV